MWVILILFVEYVIFYFIFLFILFWWDVHIHNAATRRNIVLKYSLLVIFKSSLFKQ